MPRLLLFVAVLAHASAARGDFAETSLDDLAGDRDWRVAALEIEGNASVDSGDLEEAMLTSKRAWYAPWRSRPRFDPVTFRGDLDRVKRVYERRGYYLAEIGHALRADRDEALIAVTIRIDEGPFVTVRDVAVPRARLSDEQHDVLRRRLPVAPGKRFTEEAYQRAEDAIRAFYLDRGYAHVETARSARVDRRELWADLTYRAEPGPSAVFGATTVEGLEDVEASIVTRELTYDAGETFSRAELEETRARIVALELFRSVRVQPQTEGQPRRVPIVIRVEEGPPRAIRVGAGYGTGEGVRGQFQWEHRNWLGGGRRLLVALQASEVVNEGQVTLVQPYFLSSPDDRGVISMRLFQEDETTFNLWSVRLAPRLEHRFTDELVGSIGYRIEYDDASSVDDPTIDAIGGLRDSGVLSGPTLSLFWDTTENPLDPKGGHVLGGEALQAGEIWGGDFQFWRLTLDARRYTSIGRDTVAATRLRVGFADAIGPAANLPIFERFYAGGERGVRGYARRKLGPLSDSGRPIGGRSLFEGSLELRRPVWRDLGAAVFVDFGQVSVDSFDPPVDDLEFSLGAGVTYLTPIGPLRLDVGFPLQPPPGDSSWQLHFSIGQFF